CFLALGRALGETMAVTMLIGNRTAINLSLFAKGNSIPSVIANEFTEATYDLYLSALVELGLVLLLVSITFSALSRLLIWRMSRLGARKSSSGGRFALWSRKSASIATTASQRTNGQQTPATHRPVYDENEPTNVSNSRRIHLINGLMTGVLGLCVVLTT